MKNEYEAPKVITYSEDEISRDAWSGADLLTQSVSDISMKSIFN